MIHLSNGAEVLAAYILPASGGRKPNGLVLAKKSDDHFVTWLIHWDGDTTGDDGQTHEVWECDTGHYFSPGGDMVPIDMAQFDFGLRLRHLLSSTILRGTQQTGNT